MQFLKPQVFAHRGGRKWAPENTLAAFAMACHAKVDGIEFDIQRCATGELMVMHDSDIGRTTEGVGLIKDISLGELKRLSAGLWFDEKFADETVPTLEEVLTLVDGGLTVNIEIKNTPYEYPGIEEDLLAVLEPYRYKDRIIVSSFDHQVLRRFHLLAPDYKIALLAAARLVDIGEYADKIGATHYHPGLDTLLKDAVSEAQAANLVVNTWTVNTARDWSLALSFGVDGIVTDDPAGLMQFLSKIESLRA
jgi:glycerophosphoryl diester phosphodiesterase